MKTRVLPESDYTTLETKTGLPYLLPYVNPGDVRVVVVEDDEGKIIASLAVLRAVHLEGAWIDSEHVNAGVTRALVRGAVEAAGEWSNGWALAGAADDNMRDILERLGGVKVPMDTYAVSLDRGE